MPDNLSPPDDLIPIGNAAPVGGADAGAQPQGIPAPSAAPSPSAAIPPSPYKPGSIVGGYRYKGGDWKDPTNYDQVHGDDFLKTLPPQQQALIQGMTAGKIAPPTSFALTRPYWQQALQQAMQYDPTFDEAVWPGRVKTRQDFSAGKSAQAITSFNTVMQHLGRLATSADALNNGSLPALNWGENLWLSNTGDPRINNFNVDKQAVADELTRAFRMTGGNVSDIKGWEDKINASQSPAQLHGAVNEALQLLHGRMESLSDQYRRGTGKTMDPNAFLSPGARSTYENLMNKYNGNSAAPQASAQSHGGSQFHEGQILIQGGNRFRVINGQPIYQGAAQ